MFILPTFLIFSLNLYSPFLIDSFSRDLQLVFEENFENGTGWEGNSYAFKQIAENHSFKVVDDTVFLGKYSGRFELNFSDKPATRTGLRSEVLFPKQKSNEIWYSFAVYFPQIGWSTDDDDEIISQWHNSGNPTLSLRARRDQLRVRIGHTTLIPTSQWTIYELGKIPKDAWQKMVFHVIHSSGRDGLVEVWLNDEKMFSHHGPNQFANTDLPRWKVGIYKPAWPKRATFVKRRITYFDDLRIEYPNVKL